MSYSPCEPQRKACILLLRNKNSAARPWRKKEKSWSNCLGEKIYQGFSKTVPYNYVTEFPHNISIIKAIVMLRPLFKNSILWSNNVWNWFDSEEGKLILERFGYNRYVSRKTVSSRLKWLCEHVIPLKFLSFLFFSLPCPSFSIQTERNPIGCCSRR